MTPMTPHFGHTKSGKPVHANTADHRKGTVNKKIGVAITTVVGSMWCAYVFGLLALLSLPAILTQAFHLHVFPSWLTNVSLGALVAWVSSYFLQLVLLPIIIVGQNAQAEAGDARAAKTFEDTEKIVDALDTRTQGGLTAVLEEVRATRGDLAASMETVRSVLAADAQVKAGAGSNPAGEGLPADKRVVPPAAAAKVQAAVRARKAGTA